MPHINRVVRPGPNDGTVLSESNEQLTPPKDWAFLPSGDTAITKNVKAKGTTWVVKVRKGRREISKGLWTKETNILISEKEVENKRSTPEYSKNRERYLARRKTKQKDYVVEFYTELVNFLDFHPKYKNEAKILAEKVATHATPIGSGTVARTSLIPLEKRAEATLIAWMRHKTTTYDSMNIARVKGKRREIRRLLATKSVAVLQAYRMGQKIAVNCPLKKALAEDER